MTTETIEDITINGETQVAIEAHMKCRTDLDRQIQELQAQINVLEFRKRSVETALFNTLGSGRLRSVI